MAETINGVFVRGLWGDETTRGHAKILRQISGLRAPYQPAPLVVCAWGQENHDSCHAAGYKPTLMAGDAIQNFSGAAERHRSRDGQINYGMSMWRHKLECARFALSAHSAVVWLDWDVIQAEPLPADFWERLQQGQPFRACLRQYKNKQCRWRPETLSPRKVPHGGWWYCRSLGLVERAIELHATRAPTWTDEVAWALVIDEIIGGRSGCWKGPEHYRDSGYESPYYDQRRDWVFPPEGAVFFNTGR